MRKTRVLKQLLFDQFLRDIRSFLTQRDILAKLLGELETRWGKEAVTTALENAKNGRPRRKKLRDQPTTAVKQSPQKPVASKKELGFGFRVAAKLVIESIRRMGKGGATFTSTGVAEELRSRGHTISNNWASVILSKMVVGISAVKKGHKPYPYKVTGSLGVKKDVWVRTKKPGRKKKA